MKRMVMIAALIPVALLIGGTGCSGLFNQVPTYTDADTAITTSVGQEFIIDLQHTSPRVGNHWEETHDDKILNLIDTEYTPDDKKRPDMGGTLHYRFRALEAGKTVLTFTHKTATDNIIKQKTFGINVR